MARVRDHMVERFRFLGPHKALNANIPARLKADLEAIAENRGATLTSVVIELLTVGVNAWREAHPGVNLARSDSENTQ